MKTLTIDQIVKRKFRHLTDQELINKANAAADFCWDDEGAEIDRRRRENGLKCEMVGSRIEIIVNP
jgi:hypothetical protein